MKNNESEIKFNITIVGDAKSGKSSLIKKINENNKKINFYDTNLKYKAKNFYKVSNAVLLTLDLTSIESFRSITSWIENIKLNNKCNFIILVGTKCDSKDVCIDNAKIINLCKNYINYNIKYIETSVKKNYNIKELMDLVENSISIYKTENINVEDFNKEYNTFDCDNEDTEAKIFINKKETLFVKIKKFIFFCFQ